MDIQNGIRTLWSRFGADHRTFAWPLDIRVPSYFGVLHLFTGHVYQDLMYFSNADEYYGRFPFTSPRRQRRRQTRQRLFTLPKSPAGVTTKYDPQRKRTGVLFRLRKMTQGLISMKDMVIFRPLISTPSVLRLPSYRKMTPCRKKTLGSIFVVIVCQRERERERESFYHFYNISFSFSVAFSVFLNLSSSLIE